MEHIYHYTSIEAFDKMLKEMKEAGTSNLKFWASNIHYMNDPHELRFIYDELIKVLPEIEREIGIKEYPFSAFLSINSNQGITVDFIKDIRDNVFNRIFKSAFAISFSKKKDYLPMWSLYGSNGGGLCLEFDYEALHYYYIGSDAKNLAKRMFELSYDIKDNNIWSKILNFYKYYHDVLYEQGENVNPIKQCREFTARVLLELAPYLKHPTYSYEKEVRLFYHLIIEGDADDIIAKANVEPVDEMFGKYNSPEVRVRNGLLVPYVEIDIPLDCIRAVIVGPTLYPQLQSEALRVLFRKAGIKDIKIEESAIPFRRL